MGATRENPRYNLLSLRVSDAEYKQVCEMSKQQNVSLSEAARAMLFGARREAATDGK